MIIITYPIMLYHANVDGASLDMEQLSTGEYRVSLKHHSVAILLTTRSHEHAYSCYLKQLSYYNGQV